MDFIREKIKQKPINKKKLLLKIGGAALCALVFSVVVLLMLLIFAPVIQKYVIAKNPQENMVESEFVSDTEEQTELMPSTDETQMTEGTENTQRPQFQEGLTLPPDFSLSISDYQSLQDALYEIGNKVNRSIVTVMISSEEDEDWSDNPFEMEGLSSGLIVAEDSNYLYIVSEQKEAFDGRHIRVTFVDHTGAEATVLKSDANTGLAILTVEKRKLNRTTRDQVAVAKIGVSEEMSNGSVVIALGSPLGTNYSILTGNITSVNNEIVTQDKNYSVFTTDIVAGEHASGVLVNTNGEVIGVVMQSFSGFQDMGTLTAVVVDELKDILAILIDGKDIPYMGLYVSTVTQDISADYDIPMGVYIKDVATDSPAMKAGLQSGDVIVKINDEAVLRDEEYSNIISQLIPGTTCEIIVKRQNANTYYKVTCEVEIGILQ